MFVDPAKLHAGAADSGIASQHAENGAGRLRRTVSIAGMFGGFGAADVHHQLISAAHAQHAATLNAHSEFLGAVGAKARHAGTAFTAMEERNAARVRAVECMRAVGCNCDT